MSLTLTTDANEVHRRSLLGFTNDLTPSRPELCPSVTTLQGAINDGAMAWLDLADPAGRGVFFMTFSQDAKGNGGWFVRYGFGPSANWLGYLKDVCNTFVAQGKGSVPLYYPASAPLGQFGSTTLRSITVAANSTTDPAFAKGLLRETASAALTKLNAVVVP